METETNELIQELADWMVTCAAEGTKNGSWTIYADDIVEEFTSITEESLVKCYPCCLLENMKMSGLWMRKILKNLIHRYM